MSFILFDPFEEDHVLHDGKVEMKYQAEFDWSHYVTSGMLVRPTKNGYYTVVKGSSFRRLFCKVIRLLHMVHFRCMNIDILSVYHDEIPGVKKIESELEFQMLNDANDPFNAINYELSGDFRKCVKVFGELDQLKRIHVGRIGKKSVLDIIGLCPCLITISGIWNTDFRLPKESVECICSSSQLKTDAIPTERLDLSANSHEVKYLSKSRLKTCKANDPTSFKRRKIRGSEFIIVRSYAPHLLLMINQCMTFKELQLRNFDLIIRTGVVFNQEIIYPGATNIMQDRTVVPMFKESVNPMRMVLTCRFQIDPTSMDSMDSLKLTLKSSSTRLSCVEEPKVFSIQYKLDDRWRSTNVEVKLLNLHDASIRVVVVRNPQMEFIIAMEFLKKMYSELYHYAV